MMFVNRLLISVALATFWAFPSLAQDTIKIGVNQPLTGPFAASGAYIVNGAKIAAEQINTKGGVLGKKVELVIEDNKSNPTEAAAVAEKLIVRDKVRFMMGAWGSSLTLAVMPKLMQYEVPMLVETSSSSKITQQAILTFSAFRLPQLLKRPSSKIFFLSWASRRSIFSPSMMTGAVVQPQTSRKCLKTMVLLSA